MVDEQRRRVEIFRGTALLIDVLVHALHLRRRQSNRRRHAGGIDIVIAAVETEIHLVVGKCEIEFFLTLRHRKGVGRWGPSPNFLRYAEVLGECVDLRLVEMSDRLEVSRAVSLLYKKALVVFESVGGADYRVV